MNKERILVVDDERAMLRSLERVLGSHYPIAVARSGAEALEAAPEFQPDLAILDIRMPEMDGFTLMGELRGLAPELDVIFMTGAVQELDSQLIRAIRERAFYFIQKPFDREVLLTLIERCLALRRLTSENQAYLARLEHELADARSFQQGLLPPRAARIGGVSIAASYEPCSELGGDLYDFMDAGSDGVALLIADVSGHGVSAAMLTAIVKSAFHDTRADGFDPGAVVRRVASALRPFAEDRFVTLFCARLKADGSLEYVNAGHPPVLMWGREREPSSIELTGPMISPAFPDLEWERRRIDLRAGDRLLAYTDGITETRGAEGMFGHERLFGLVGASRATGTDLLEEVCGAVREFSGGRPEEDDRTLLTVGME